MAREPKRKRIFGKDYIDSLHFFFRSQLKALKAVNAVGTTRMLSEIHH